MKASTNNSYPELRRCYDRIDDLGRVINRKRTTVWKKLKGETEFTAGEMFLILRDLVARGIEETVEPATYKKYFERRRT